MQAKHRWNLPHLFGVDEKVEATPHMSLMIRWKGNIRQPSGFKMKIEATSHIYLVTDQGWTQLK